MPQPSRVKYAEDSDELVIEDETERVALTGNIPVGTSVTGIFFVCLLHCRKHWSEYRKKNLLGLHMVRDCILNKCWAGIYCILSILGSIVALCGHTIDSGKFFVEEHCYSGLPYQTVPNLDPCLSNGEDRSETLPVW